MLAQENRFHGHGSLRFVYKNGRAVRSSLVTVKYIANPHRKHSRFAVVISKKVLKSAVKRNRLRRRIYEIIHQELSTLKPGYDTVILVFSPELLVMEHEQLVDLLKKIFSTGGLYK